MPVRGGTLQLVSVAVIAALTIAFAVACATIGLSQIHLASIASNSMEPTLQPGDKVIYRTGQGLRPGDLVIARSGPAGPRGFLLVRRVIGLPGDHVACCTVQGLVTVNDRPLHENYLYPGNAPSEVKFSVTLARGQVWLMGDRRLIALDSRERGPEPLTDIVGRITMIDHNGHFTDVRTPAGYIAAGLAPPDHREPLPYRYFAAAIVAVLVLIVEVVVAVLLLIRWRRRKAAPPASWAQVPAGYSP
jgi:signal peptidase I